MISEQTDGPLCEACRQRPATAAIDADDPSQPYRVCRGCGERLERRALRPLEWFNLAAIHGWQKFLLHDDFYDQDGTACQPDTKSYAPEALPAPSLDQAATTLERLTDYCVTRRELGAAELAAFKAYDGDAILAELDRRAQAGNRSVVARTLELCALVLERDGEQWVRGQYARGRSDGMLFPWAQAAARCLPEPEGLQRTLDALQAFAGRELQEQKAALSWFRSPTVLDWIESQVPPANITSSWGQLASLSDLSWGRVQGWIARGRPLSLVALDALTTCIPRRGQAPIVDLLKPILKGCADRAIIAPELEAHMLADSAPRVVQRCEFIIAHLDDLRVE